jgi:hypothetical protein
MEKKDTNPDYSPVVFINELCLHVNPMRGRKHRMIYEKNLLDSSGITTMMIMG